jgi:hypothetical protein
MYYELPSTAPLMQGEIIDDCPILFWQTRNAGWDATESTEQVLILTQACDLSSAKTTRVQVAIVHAAQRLVDLGLLKAQTVVQNVRRHQVFGWYFLPAGERLPESIVDLRDIHTVPVDLLLELARGGKRRCALATPFREHLAQHFSVTYSRIGLPEPYATE